MELTEKQMDAISKGYETMPIALDAVTEQLNKMNEHLTYMVTKQRNDEDKERVEVEEEKMRKQIEKELKKQAKDKEDEEKAALKAEKLALKATDTAETLKKGDLMSEEASPHKAKPQSEPQEQIEGGGSPSGAGKTFKKADEDEDEEKKPEDLEEAKKANDDEEEKKQEDEDEDKEKKLPPEFEKMFKNFVTAAVEDEIKKLGWVKTGVTTKSLAGKEDTPIIKAEAPADRDKLIGELSKLSYRELTQLEADVHSGKIKMPLD